MRVCLSGGMRCERWRGAPLLVGGGGCQLFDLSAFRLVDLLGSRKVGELAGRGGGGEGAGAGFWFTPGVRRAQRWLLGMVRGGWSQARKRRMQRGV